MMLDHAQATFSQRATQWHDKAKLIVGSRGESERLLKVVATLVSPGSRVIDIGTGRGKVLRSIGRIVRPQGLHLLDVSPSMLLAVREDHPVVQSLSLCNAERLCFQDDVFDVATMLHVLHHLERPEACIAEASRVLKPGGKLVFLTLGPGYQDSIIPWIERDHRFDPFGRISIPAIARWLAAAALKIETIYVDRFEFSFADSENYVEFMDQVGLLSRWQASMQGQEVVPKELLRNILASRHDERPFTIEGEHITVVATKAGPLLTSESLSVQRCLEG